MQIDTTIVIAALIVIVLAYLIYTQTKKSSFDTVAAAPAAKPSAPVKSDDTPIPTAADAVKAAAASAEAEQVKKNAEGCTYSETDFDGGSYVDYAATMGVDEQVHQDHAEFIKDMNLQRNHNVAGAMMVDAHDSYDPIPWIGIRGRPQAVEADEDNVTQLPDIDKSLYAKDTLRW